MLSILKICLFHLVILFRGAFPVTLFFLCCLDLLCYHTKYDNITITQLLEKDFQNVSLHIIKFSVLFPAGNILDNNDEFIYC